MCSYTSLAPAIAVLFHSGEHTEREPEPKAVTYVSGWTPTVNKINPPPRRKILIVRKKKKKKIQQWRR